MPIWKGPRERRLLAVWPDPCLCWQQLWYHLLAPRVWPIPNENVAADHSHMRAKPVGTGLPCSPPPWSSVELLWRIHAIATIADVSISFQRPP